MKNSRHNDEFLHGVVVVVVLLFSPFSIETHVASETETMSGNFELEEFDGLGTVLAPRIPNAENRDLEAKVCV